MFILIAFTAISQMGISQCSVDGGTISTLDPTTICVDGIGDPINILVAGGVGTESAWIITDAGNNILATPLGGPFDLDGAGGGTCLIWYIRHDGTLSGNIIGNNISDLIGCFDLSNEITVTRNEPIGGTLAGGPYEFCVGDGVADNIPVGDVTVSGNQGETSQWVVTDDQRNILGLPPSPDVVDFDGAGGGMCYIYNISYYDILVGLAVGMSLDNVSGCLSESDNFIVVVRNEPIGGTLAGGPYEFCVGDGVADNIPVGDVTVSGNQGETSQWVVTDDQRNILGLPPSPDVVDFDGAGGGMCYIYNVSYYGTLTGLAVGMSLDNVSGCLSESDNFIVVVRNEPIGGTLAGGPYEFCVGDGVADNIPVGDVTVSGNQGETSQWVVTDDQRNILGLPPSPDVVDFDGAGGGMCYIYNVSYYGTLTGLAVGMSLDNVGGCLSESDNFVTVVRNEPDGGTLSTDDETTICVDGIPDPIEVMVEDAEGANSQWIITNDTFLILAKPPGPIFDLDGAGSGICLIWYMRYDGIIMGDTLGGVLDSISGCFDLSDSLVVTRNEPIGGTLAGGPYEFCVGDGEADNIPVGDVTVSGNQGEINQWVVTDDQRNILGLPPSPDVVDFDGAGGGMCYIFNVSYYGTLTGLSLGMNLDNVVGCLSESDNFITVVRNEPIGGTLTGGPYEFCVGDGEADNIPVGDVTVSGNQGEINQWVVTDDQRNILGLPPSPDVVDFDGAGGGMCYIFNVSYYGTLTGLSLGMNLDNVVGCLSESDNFITVVRNEPIGGTLTGGPYEFCVGDGEADNIPVGDVTVSGNQGATSQWVVTDDQRNILGLPPSPDVVDFDGAGDGMCYIFNVSYYGTVTGLVTGMNLDDVEGCLSESNNFITVVRNEPIGGIISTTDPTTICVDGIGDPINVSLTGEAGTNSAWVITDENLNILAIPSGPPFDLDGEGPGICLIWHLSFEDGLQGAEVGLNAGDLEGCYELSNSISVTRDEVDGATVSLLNGETLYSNCPGNVTFDVQNTSENVYFNYYYVITNENDIILALVDASITNTLDLSAAPAGECHVWGWNSIGTTTPVMGNHISSLEGLDCEELSDNFITVLRTLPDGGYISLDDGSTEYEGCAGEIDFDLTFQTSTFLNYWFVVTDDNDNILTWFNSDNGGWIDLNGAPPGVCRIYGWNEMDLPEPTVGAHISSLSQPLCGDVSENWVTITRLDCETDDCEASGGNIYTSTGNIENRVVVANRASGTVSVINSDNDEVIATHDMPNDGEPMYVVYNSVNNTYLIGDYNGYVVAFDANDFSSTGNVQVGDGVFHMWMSPDNNQLWVNNELDRTISVVNPTSLEKIATVQLPTDLYDLGYKPHDVILMPNSAAAFVTVLGSLDQDYVLKYSTSTFEETDRVAVGQDPHVALTSNNDNLYVAAQASNELYVFNRGDLSLITQLEIPNAHGLGVNASGTYLYIGNISDGGTNATFTLDLATNELVGDPVDAPFSAPHNYAVSGDDKLFVTHSGAANNQVSIYDLTPTPVLSTTVEVGSNPFGLAAFSISTTTDVSICVDGQPDPIEVVRDGNGVGAQRTFVITDAEGNILAIPTDNGPFDLDPAGSGTCEIWYLGYESGLQGLEVGGNLSELDGCFGLSNPITVIREEPDGGTIQLAGGGDIYSNCAGQVVFDVEHMTTAPNLSYWYIITDDNDNILAFQNSADGQTLDLSAAPAGECHVWGWNYRGLDDPIIGDNISTLTDDFCEAISDNFITVNREIPDGGMVQLAGGGDVYSNCAGQIVFDVEHMTTAPNLSYWYIITDDNDNILAFQNSADGQTLDLSAAPAGECHVWGWNYRGLDDPIIGDNISTLTDDFCEAISDNFITVNREIPDGGMVQLAGGGDVYSNCAGQIVFDVEHMTTAPNLSYWYIITDDNDNILAFQNSADGQTLDLSAAPAGECHVWGWNYRGLDDPIIGDNISTLTDDFCEAISDNFITVNREIPDGGMVQLAGGGDVYSNCAGQVVFDVEHMTTAPNLSYWYIITDDNDNILAFQNSADGQTLDLSAAPAGECHVWGWNYRGLDDPIIGDNISTLTDDFCEAISDNFITVNREIPDGGMVQLAGGGDVYSNCAGQVVFDVEHMTTAPNLSYWYIITDDNDNILAFQNSADGQTLDLSAAPAGECHVWGWNYRGLDDPIIGDNISTLTDDFCEAISDNFITVNREIPDGGMVQLAGGGDVYSNCAGQVVFDVEHMTTAPNLSYWYIITDDNDNILAFQNSADGQTLDLSAAPAGECHVWGWNYRGLDDPIIGDNISTLTDDFCEAISDNFITVNREIPDGGMVQLAGGGDVYSNCAGQVVFDVEHMTTAPNLSYWYIITDDNDNILAFQNSADGQTLDLSAAPAGECHVWGWNYRGLDDPIIGDNISTLTDDFCEAISDNFITVNREIPDGGMVLLSDGTDAGTFEAGDVVFDVQHETSAPNLSYWYIITDDNDNILAFQNSADGSTLDLSIAPVGECHVWGWNYRGLDDPIIGDHISTLADDFCEAISDNFITITRIEPTGAIAATISTTDNTSICVDGNGDPIAITVDGGQGENSAYVITDIDSNILALPPMGPFDLDGAGEGVCLIWHLYYDSVEGLEVGLNTNDFTGEFALSNAISVTRQSADGGVVALTNGLDTATYCVGEVVFDVMHETEATALGYWYIITDNNDNILAFHNTEDGPTLDLSIAPAGECHIWGWSSDGNTTPTMGEAISSLDIDCGSISSNFISIFRVEGIVGGIVSTESSVVACPNDGEDDFVNITTTGGGDVYVYIVTDEDDQIIGTPTLAPTINFEDMEPGIARIYGLGYAGIVEIGNSIIDINGTCSALSLNFIEVVVQETAECAVTSTKELNENNVKIYPNPAVNLITVEYNELSQNAIVKVFDLQGKLVLTQDLTEGNGVSNLEIENLFGGMYLIKVVSNEDSITKRILISK